MMKKLISILLTSIMVLSGTAMSFAGKSTVFINEEEGFVLERIVEGNKVLVAVRNSVGEITNIIKVENGVLSLDGQILSSTVYSNIKPMIKVDVDKNDLLRAVSWGRWQTSSETLSTGGLSTAIIAGIVAASAPWISVRVAAAVATAVAGKYDEIEIEWRIRYGMDDEFEYYERETSFYGDGKHIYGPISDKGKNALDW